MSTVASRTVRSSPHRDASSTWETIVDLLTKGANSVARQELLSVTGIACSLISDQTPKDSAIVVTSDGPRTRIYCVYDEDAIGGSGAKEDALGYDALQGDWAVSLPCQENDLPWVERALKGKSERITARDMSSALGDLGKSAVTAEDHLTVNLKAFLGS